MQAHSLLLTLASVSIAFATEAMAFGAADPFATEAIAPPPPAALPGGRCIALPTPLAGNSLSTSSTWSI